MSIAYKLKVNQQPASPVSNEQHTVGISGVFTSTPDRIRLVQVPLQEVVSSVIIPGYSEIPFNGPAPIGTQFAVDYSTGRVYFNASQNGNTVFVSYKGLGSEVDAEDVNEIEIPVGIALNQDGSLVNGIVHPNNISTIFSDDFLFPRDVTATRNVLIEGTTLFINTGEAGAPTLNAQFVVNRGSSTPVSLEWDESLGAWEFVNNTTPVFQFFNSGVFNFGGPLHIGDGTVSLPAYSFTSDSDSGIYKRLEDSIGISCNGMAVADFNSAAGLSLRVQSGFQVLGGVALFPDGTMAAPSISFLSDIDTGIFKAAEDILAFATNGMEVIRIDASQKVGINTTNTAANYQVRINSTGKLGLSIYSTSSASAAYLFLENDGANTWNLANNGTTTSHPNTFDVVYNGSVEFRLDSTGHAQFSDGSTLAPSITFISEPTTGISKPFASTLAFSIAGVGEAARITPTGDFQIQQGEKIIFDGIGNVFVSYTPSNLLYGQTDLASGAFHLGSAQDMILFSHAVVGNGEPNLQMLTDGTVHFYNSNQGTAANRTLQINISQGFASGYHRTVQLFPTGTALSSFTLGLGYQANGTDVVASTIDTENSLPLQFNINDVTVMTVNPTTLDMASHKITSLADPVADTDAANKRYVNNVAAGLDTKASTIAGTTTNLTVTASGSGVGKLLTATSNGVLTIDGYSTWTDMVNDGGVNDPFSTSLRASRVLIKNQTTASDNGIYAVQQKGDGSHPFILVRAVDFDGSPSNEVAGGDFTFVEQGTSLVNTGWVVVYAGTIVVDTNPINWTQFSAGAIPVVASDPGSPTVGQIWFNTTDNQFKGQNNSVTVIIG